MIILYNNYVFDATISALTENPDYTFNTALNDTRLSRVGRSVDDAAQTFTFDLGSAKAVDYFFILEHNISDSATITIQGNATDVWTSPSVSETVNYNADYLYYAFSSSETYRYWRFYVSDDNSDEYIEFSYAFIGDKLEAPGMSQAKVFNRKTNTSAQKSTSGQLYADRRLPFKGKQITFPVATESECTAVDNFWDEVEIARPFILLVWENDLDIEPPLYCNLTKELEWGQLDNQGLLWTLPLEFEQCF